MASDWAQEPEKEEAGRDSQVDLGMKALQDAIQRVENQSDRLIGRVSSLTLPAEPSPESNVKAVEPVMSPMAAALHHQAERLRGLSYRLADVVGRLDV